MEIDQTAQKTTANEDKDPGCRGFTPSIGKIVIVASADEHAGSTQALRSSCLCFNSKTQFASLVRTDDSSAITTAEILVPEGRWKTVGSPNTPSEALDAFKMTTEGIDVTEVAVLVVPEEMREAILRGYDHDYKPFFRRKGGARALLFNFDRGNSLLGVSEYSN